MVNGKSSFDKIFLSRDGEVEPDLEGDCEEMVKVQAGEHCFYLNHWLQINLDFVKKAVLKANYDCFIVVSGREGFGKSTLAMQIATYLDPTFNLDRCCFNDKQFIESATNSTKGQAIVFDETMGYLASRGAMSKFNRSLIKIFSEMRSKNLFIILCIPNFFELDRYPAMHRSTSMLFVYKRGCFGSYDYNTKKKLYIIGKKYYTYSVPPNFRGNFVKYFPLNQEEYEKKKQKTINEFNKVKKDKENEDFEEIEDKL